MDEKKETAIPQKKRTFKRSPSYPGIDLKNALDKAKIFYLSEGENKANIEIAVQLWGYKNSKVGQALITIAALIKFGLIETEGSGIKKTVRLSKLALNIVRDDRTDSPERESYIKQSALLPLIHAELWKEFNGSFPSDDNLKHVLKMEREFSDKGAVEFLKQFKATIAHAKLEKSDGLSYIKKDNNGENETDSQNGENGQHYPNRQHVPKKPPIIDPEINKDIDMRTYPIAFLDGTQGSLSIPLPMSNEDWERLKTLIDFLQPVHVKGYISGKGKIESKVDIQSNDEPNE